MSSQYGVENTTTYSAMGRCEFVYNRRRGHYRLGDQCREEGKYKQQTLCVRHYARRERELMRSEFPRQNDDEFPRVYNDLEEKLWVDEARKITSPEENQRRAGVSCGMLHSEKNLFDVKEGRMHSFRKKTAASARQYTENIKIDNSEFEYEGRFSQFNGVVLDKNGFVYEDENRTQNGKVVAKMGKSCFESVERKKMPKLALANGLWTGACTVPELSGLTWLEEKLIARSHISIQIQKCRLIRKSRIDAFYPQRQLKGNRCYGFAQCGEKKCGGLYNGCRNTTIFMTA